MYTDRLKVMGVNLMKYLGAIKETVVDSTGEAATWAVTQAEKRVHQADDFQNNIQSFLSSMKTPEILKNVESVEFTRVFGGVVIASIFAIFEFAKELKDAIKKIAVDHAVQTYKNSENTSLSLTDILNQVHDNEEFG